jgi:hypothetical protein
LGDLPAGAGARTARGDGAAPPAAVLLRRTHRGRQPRIPTSHQDDRKNTV